MNIWGQRIRKQRKKINMNKNGCKYVRGNVRLSMGMYRTPEESDKYIKESLLKPLP